MMSCGNGPICVPPWIMVGALVSSRNLTVAGESAVWPKSVSPKKGLTLAVMVTSKMSASATTLHNRKAPTRIVESARRKVSVVIFLPPRFLRIDAFLENRQHFKFQSPPFSAGCAHFDLCGTSRTLPQLRRASDHSRAHRRRLRPVPDASAGKPQQRHQDGDHSKAPRAFLRPVRRQRLPAFRCQPFSSSRFPLLPARPLRRPLSLSAVAMNQPHWRCSECCAAAAACPDITCLPVSDEDAVARACGQSGILSTWAEQVFEVLATSAR